MNRQQYFQDRYIEELGRRSEPGTFGFMFTVSLVMIVSYYIEPWWPVAIPVGIAIFAVNLARHRLSRLFVHKRISPGTFVPWVVVAIVTNAALWNVLFISAYIHDQMRGVASTLSFLIVSSFSAGATASLFALRAAQFTFQGMLVLPLMGMVVYYGIVTGSVDYWAIAFVCTAFFFFNFKATQSYRRDLADLFHREYELIETRQRLAEEQEKLIHSSRLASLGEMAGGLAHEINNPLAILMLGLDALEAPSKQEDPVAFRQSKIIMMRRAVDRISKIIRGLRHFSQQGDALPLEHVSLRSIVDETLEFFVGRLRNSQIDCEVIGELDSKVHARPVQISQVLLNLLSNALDAVAKSPEKKIRIEVRRESGCVLVEVSDTGGGLHPSIKERLFQPFATSKLPGQGMGLGLSISRGIMREHGGDLHFLADRARTTFQMKIPV